MEEELELVQEEPLEEQEDPSERKEVFVPPTLEEVYDKSLFDNFSHLFYVRKSLPTNFNWFLLPFVVPVCELFDSFKRGKATVFSHEDSFDGQLIRNKYLKDLSFLKSIEKYTHFPRFDYFVSPFSYEYEKMFWTFTAYKKTMFTIQDSLFFLNSEPFGPQGRCIFWESHALNHPEECKAYIRRIEIEVKNKYLALNRAYEVFNRDLYGEYEDGFLMLDCPDIKLGKFDKKARREASKKVWYESRLPEEEIERHEEPKK
ncbi:hypothetical protein MHC_05710 [Mycoplasma haemocanis str. Illinois]|uniref:Uncharacterized protein n=1 Tax=Mycoplasma haemocanis (strain Illinois) TaxID=1111676 RepID=H6N8M3_MYCHN|nr:hypothetical protein [Mycoplasma haemocanis]AEW45995.1 hypothetical protein MHC_05710 [Mycoplasma haemocanis str. Illinois]